MECDGRGGCKGEWKDEEGRMRNREVKSVVLVFHKLVCCDHMPCWEHM